MQGCERKKRPPSRLSIAKKAKGFLNPALIDGEGSKGTKYGEVSMRNNANATVRVRPVDAAPLHGVVAGAKVMTLEGELPVEYLMPGDRVLTRGGARVLRSVEVAVAADAAMVRISAETLGVDTPEDDMLVSPGQPVMVRDWRARAMCGAASGMVAAARLVDGEYIRVERIKEIRIFTLRFDEMAVIYVGGLELGCPSVAVTA